MKRCLRYHLRVLLHIRWLSLLPPALGLLMGWEAAAALRGYAGRFGAPEARSALALLLDIRHFIPLAGAAWAAAFLGIEFDARGASLPLLRGCSRLRVFSGKLFLYFSGCAVISAAAQTAAVLPSLSVLRGVPLSVLLRCCGLRLLLDLGMASPPAAIAVIAGENRFGRAITILYGLLLWRIIGSHYDLWLPGKAALSSLWPLAALPLGPGVCALALWRREF